MLKIMWKIGAFSCSIEKAPLFLFSPQQVQVYKQGHVKIDDDMSVLLHREVLKLHRALRKRERLGDLILDVIGIGD